MDANYCMFIHQYPSFVLTCTTSFACEHFITLLSSYVTLNVCKYFFLDSIVKAIVYTLQCPFKIIACLASMDLSCEQKRLGGGIRILRWLYYWLM